jgi:hypothetical protein
MWSIARSLRKRLVDSPAWPAPTMIAVTRSMATLRSARAD